MLCFREHETVFASLTFLFGPKEVGSRYFAVEIKDKRALTSLSSAEGNWIGSGTVFE